MTGADWGISGRERVVIQLSYGNVTTLDMGGLEGEDTKEMSANTLTDYHERLILKTTDRQSHRVNNIKGSVRSQSGDGTTCP